MLHIGLSSCCCHEEARTEDPWIRRSDSKLEASHGRSPVGKVYFGIDGELHLGAASNQLEINFLDQIS